MQDSLCYVHGVTNKVERAETVELCFDPNFRKIFLGNAATEHAKIKDVRIGVSVKI